MGHIPWDPTLETGDATIDEHHRELFRIVNDLRAACVDTAGPSAVTVVLDRLASYVDIHFGAEETLMASTHYPLAETLEHKAAHAALRERAKALIDQYRAGEVATVLPLVEFLFEWLRSHIRDVDARFVKFMQLADERA